MEFWKKDYLEKMVLEFGADRGRKNPGIEMWTMETATMGTKAHWCNSSWVTPETTNHYPEVGLKCKDGSKRKAEQGGNRTQSTVHCGEVLAFGKE